MNQEDFWAALPKWSITKHISTSQTVNTLNPETEYQSENLFQP